MLLVVPLWFVLITVICVYLFFVGVSGEFSMQWLP